jgi:FtsP/CotA-like multicopper oxidase with cupredoxin domain
MLAVAAATRVAAAQEQSPAGEAGQFLAAEKTQRFLMGPDVSPTDLWTFRTQGKLPVLRARQGQEFRFRVLNELPEEIWLHFFGVRGPADMMSVAVPPGPGGDLEVVFTPPDAGTFWFGPLLNASRLRDMGLAGMLIVEEATAIPGMVDIPLIVDDWMLDDQGRMDQTFGSLDAAIGEGRMGNWFTVNGDYKPRIDLDRGKPTRLRVLNVCNTRTVSLQLKNVDVMIIAEDGQPVTPRAPGLEPLTLAPGQRVDLLVVTVLDQAVISLDLMEDVVEAAFLLGQGTAGQGLADSFALPANPLPVAGSAEPRSVPLLIAGGEKGGLQSARVGEETLDLRKLLEKGLAWAINGVAGLGGPFLFEAQKGETLLLVVENKTGFAQPIHVHGHVWQVVEQAGAALDGQPWRDTAVIPGSSTAKLLLVADNPGPWAIQSLVAERCDAGLIGAFRVT